MTPDFGTFLLTGIGLALLMLAFLGWRFGAVRLAVFVVVAGLFPAAMDFVSSFAVENYEYPGQTRLWVFTYIFFGWMTVCGTCTLLAEGILARGDEDLFSPRLRLRLGAPLLAALIAVALDLFIDPVAVAVGYWVWLVPANVYYGIPLLNFVGWFVLMFLAPLAWLSICGRPWGAARQLLAAALSLPLLMVASVALSLVLNGLVAVLGFR